MNARAIWLCDAIANRLEFATCNNDLDVNYDHLRELGAIVDPSPIVVNRLEGGGLAVDYVYPEGSGRGSYRLGSKVLKPGVTFADFAKLQMGKVESLNVQLLPQTCWEGLPKCRTRLISVLKAWSLHLSQFPNDGGNDIRIYPNGLKLKSLRQLEKHFVSRLSKKPISRSTWCKWTKDSTFPPKPWTVATVQEWLDANDHQYEFQPGKN